MVAEAVIGSALDGIKHTWIELPDVLIVIILHRRANPTPACRYHLLLLPTILHLQELRMLMDLSHGVKIADLALLRFRDSQLTCRQLSVEVHLRLLHSSAPDDLLARLQEPLAELPDQPQRLSILPAVVASILAVDIQEEDLNCLLALLLLLLLLELGQLEAQNESLFNHAELLERLDLLIRRRSICRALLAVTAHAY